MKIFNDFCTYLSEKTSINYDIIFLVFSSLSILVVFGIIKKLCKKFINAKFEGRSEFFFNQRLKLVINLIEIICLIAIWSSYIDNLMTLISVVSAAMTIALREMIVNIFCGIYIQAKKPFKVEDRIQIEDIKGDVINTTLLGFEILEVSTKEENGQSTGIIVHFPNSIIINKPVKNINKGFKYIWNEQTIRVKLDCDLANNKKCIYKIVNSIDVITDIPRKMKNQIKDISSENRIYFNQYDPIIYTKIVEDHIELTVRYLMHPKKARIYESVIWNKIYIAYKNGEIDLFIGNDD